MFDSLSNQEKTIFFITPLGVEGSDDRLRFERVCKTILTPAIKNSRYKLISALDFPLASQINQEVINCVENAALCVADVTGSNPNVMYELGIRRQTGRPYLTIKEKGDTVPFDIIVEKYQEYELTDVDSVVNAQNEISGFVETLDSSKNYKPAASIPVMYDQLLEIESKLDRLLRKEVGITQKIRADKTVPNRSLGMFADGFMAPRERFHKAIMGDDADAAVAAVVNWAAANQPTSELLLSLGLIARSKASEIGRILLMFEDWRPEDGAEVMAFIVALNSLADDVVASGDANILIKNAEEWLSNDDLISGEQRASAANQLGMFFWSHNIDQKSLDWSQLAANLDPTEAAYFFNTSLSKNKLFGAEKALEDAERAYKIGKEKGNLDDAHLDHLVDVYCDLQRYDDAKQINDVLREISPIRAEINASKYEF